MARSNETTTGSSVDAEAKEGRQRSTSRSRGRSASGGNVALHSEGHRSSGSSPLPGPSNQTTPRHRVGGYALIGGYERRFTEQGQSALVNCGSDPYPLRNRIKRRATPQATIGSTPSSSSGTQENSDPSPTQAKKPRTKAGSSGASGSAGGSRKKMADSVKKELPTPATAAGVKTKLPIPASAEETPARPTGSGEPEASGHPTGGSTTSVSPGSAAPGPSTSGSSSEMNRLQVLLESRGWSPHLFGSLGPRMQSLLHRSMGTSSKTQNLLCGLQAVGDEGQQLQAASEMCQLLVMGNEDTLAGFPIKPTVTALVNLLKMEHNFHLMNHACRALTYMMEALPRSTSLVAEAIPVFLSKVQVIECMDVAEQSLIALEMLSRRHSKTILQANGVESCLMYLDFFSINAQRAALSITANCCSSVVTDSDFHLVEGSLPILTAKITQQDRRSVESVCQAFSRLVDNFMSNPLRLEQIATIPFLKNIQQLLTVSPPIVSSSVFVAIIRVLSVLSAGSPTIALTLLTQNIGETLCYLLLGSAAPFDASAAAQLELVSRNPQELYEIVSLVGELMPALPNRGVFSIDSCLSKSGPPSVVTWEWRDDRGEWHPYSPADCKIIEAAHSAGEDDLSLTHLGRSYTVDLAIMKQINEDTQTARPIQRRVCGSKFPDTDVVLTNNRKSEPEAADGRSQLLHDNSKMAAKFIESLFHVIYQVYSSSAGPQVRHRSFRVLLRMTHFADASLLESVLRSQEISAQLAGMLSSADYKSVVGAMQMAFILMEKLPGIFAVFFKREGVMHQISELAGSQKLPLMRNFRGQKVASAPDLTGAVPSPPPVSRNRNPDSFSIDSNESRMEDGSSSPCSSRKESSSSNHEKMISNRLSDVLKRKRRPAALSRQKEPRRPSSSSQLGPSSPNPAVGTAGGQANLSTSGGGSLGGHFKRHTSRASSLLASLAPSGWGRSGGQHGSAGRVKFFELGSSNKDSPPSAPTPPPAPEAHSLGLSETSIVVPAESPSTRDKVRLWVRESAEEFLASYGPLINGEHGASQRNVLEELASAVNALRGSDVANRSQLELTSAFQKVADILVSSDVSPFEILHSKLIETLDEILGPKSPQCEACSGHLQEVSPTPVSNSHKDKRRELKRSSCSSQHSPSSSPHAPGCHGNATPGPAPPLPLAPSQPPGSSSASSFSPLAIFVYVFVQNGAKDGNPAAAFSALVSKVLGCLHQLEQFPVKVNEIPGIERNGVSSQLKFLNTHQIKCLLQRHPECKNLKQWKGGPVKIDPLALVQAIERYLIMRGYGRRNQSEDQDYSDDDQTDEDLEDSLVAMITNQSLSGHRVQFLIGNNVLPYNMTVYQAIRQYSVSQPMSPDSEDDAHLGGTDLWSTTHVIYYRAFPEGGDSSSAQPSSRGRRKRAVGGGKRKGPDTLWTQGRIPSKSEPPLLERALASTTGEVSSLADPSVPVLSLLRELNVVNQLWGSLEGMKLYAPLLSQQEFLSSKLTAKSNRQVMDPVVVMTGNIPPWVSQLALACPFLLPFETRNLVFYTSTFDRERAIMRIMGAAQDAHPNESSERVAPRLERRRKKVSRTGILEQAEKLMSDMSGSKAVLEIEFEDEVGTGLGPTLEFYTLVSLELRQPERGLWRETSGASGGLFPKPLPHGAKGSNVNQLRSKFRFLGRLFGRSLMDQRLLDIPLARPFYKWLLGREGEMEVADLIDIDPLLGQTFVKLLDLAKDAQANAAEIESLYLDFTLPGKEGIELMKGGKNISVAASNLEQYLELVLHWTLVEGPRPLMESFREGFEEAIPLHSLTVFYPHEMDGLFCGNTRWEKWDTCMLMESCRPDHGYTHDSRAIRWFFEILSSYEEEEQRTFLQFLTGTPRLPVGGFRSLNPPLRIVRKTVSTGECPDAFLPSVMTCVNYLKLPDYSSLEIMREKLRIAATDGSGTFHLS